MHMFGFKIVDRCADEIEPLVARALEEQRPLEIGLYFADPRARELLEGRLPGSGLAIAVHLDHRRLSLSELGRREAELRKQLTVAARLGAALVITHISRDALARPLPPDDALREWLMPSLRFTSAICAEYGLQVHIENTFDGVAFYRWFFRQVLDGGIDRIHACFDLGHAKAWSTDSLTVWLSLLSDLRATGLGLHFHLHANRGLSDEHLSFPEAERIGITGPDRFTAGRDYYQALAEIAERFPAASKIFEVPADEAEKNLEHVLQRIAGRQA